MWLHNLSPFTLSYVLTPVKPGASITTEGERKAPREEQGSFKVYQTSAAQGKRDAAMAAAAHVVSGRQRVMLDAEFGEAALSVALGASCHSELIPLDQVRTGGLQRAPPTPSTRLRPLAPPKALPARTCVCLMIALASHRTHSSR